MRQKGMKYGTASIRSILSVTTLGLITLSPVSAQTTPAPVPAPAAADAEVVDKTDIIVTATRKSESLSKVPISISAFSNARLEVLGIKSFADVAKFTPGVVFNSERKDVAIRGISSEAGTGTTGIYIDDTPIQVRALGLNANNTLPAVFDLDRVEVLRGPQGTLFGAGSEGGTVRYISTAPSLEKYSGRVFLEGSATQKGSPNYEGGVAFGGPIAEGKLGFRASAWYRRDGGYIDRVDYQTRARTEKDANYTDTFVGQGALAWALTPSLTITPSVYYQDRKQHQNDRYWVGISDPSTGSLLNGTPDRQEDRDHFVLPALKIEFDSDAVKIISNTSYYSRKEVVNGYSGTLYNLSLFQQLLSNENTDDEGNVVSTGQNFDGDPYTNPTQLASKDGLPLLTATGINLPQLPGYQARVFITNQQQNFTQEIRFQQGDPSARLQWVAGAFYSQNRQVSTEEIYDPQLPTLVPLLFGGTWQDFSTDADGNFYDLLANGDSYINHTVGKDWQLAVFADATWAITDKLKVSAGIRFASTKFSFDNFADGPQNIGFSSGTGQKSENPVTPKFNISYQATPDDLFYATASKGYRIGGANPPFPQQACQNDLDTLGITTVPSTYNSDTVWNYEVGSKNKFFDRRLSVATSAYYLKWKNIQQANYLTSCGFQYTGNFGDVTSKGFDVQLNASITRQLTFDLAVGYTEARYSKTTYAGTTQDAALANKGDTIPGVSPWTVTVGGQYDFTIGGADGFVRADYEFASRNPYLTTAANNATGDPALINDPQTNQVSARAGMTFGKLEVQVFGNNLLNSHPQLGITHQDQFTALFEAETLRPRTLGMSVGYKF